MTQTLLTLTIVAILSSSFTLFIDKLLRPHMLLDWWWYYLDKIMYLWDENMRMTRFEKILYFFRKPLGKCIYCYGTWFNIITFMGLKYFNVINLHWAYLIFSIGINYIILIIFITINGYKDKYD